MEPRQLRYFVRVGLAAAVQPGAVAARVTLREVAAALVHQGRWPRR